MSDWKQFGNCAIRSMSRIVEQKYVVKGGGRMPAMWIAVAPARSHGGPGGATTFNTMRILNKSFCT